MVDLYLPMCSFPPVACVFSVFLAYVFSIPSFAATNLGEDMRWRRRRHGRRCALSTPPCSFPPCTSHHTFVSAPRSLNPKVRTPPPQSSLPTPNSSITSTTLTPLLSAIKPMNPCATSLISLYECRRLICASTVECASAKSADVVSSGSSGVASVGSVAFGVVVTSALMAAVAAFVVDGVEWTGWEDLEVSEGRCGRSEVKRAVRWFCSSVRVVRRFAWVSEVVGGCRGRLCGMVCLLQGGSGLLGDGCYGIGIWRLDRVGGESWGGNVECGGKDPRRKDSDGRGLGYSGVKVDVVV